MNKDQIRTLQNRIGVDPDGIWGPKSTKAAEDHLSDLMPKPSKWPKSDQASLRAFYGRPGDETNLVGLPVPEGVIMKYEGKQVATIRCHRKVEESLGRVMKELSKVCPAVLLKYAGCYNNRSVRGGSTPSLHAYGAAIDFDPDTNGNHQHWPVGATMPIEVMEAFAKEGWLSAGAFWSRDAMHSQATQ